VEAGPTVSRGAQARCWGAPVQDAGDDQRGAQGVFLVSTVERHALSRACRMKRKARIAPLPRPASRQTARSCDGERLPFMTDRPSYMWWPGWIVRGGPPFSRLGRGGGPFPPSFHFQSPEFTPGVVQHPPGGSRVWVRLVPVQARCRASAQPFAQGLGKNAGSRDRGTRPRPGSAPCGRPLPIARGHPPR